MVVIRRYLFLFQIFRNASLIDTKKCSGTIAYPADHWSRMYPNVELIWSFGTTVLVLRLLKSGVGPGAASAQPCPVDRYQQRRFRPSLAQYLDAKSSSGPARASSTLVT